MDSDIDAVPIIGSIISPFVAAVAIFGLPAAVLHLFAGGLDSTYSYDRWLDRNLLSATTTTTTLWWVLAICALAAFVLLVAIQPVGFGLAAAAVVGVVFVWCAVNVVTGEWDNDKDEARYDAGSVTFVVPDLGKVPAPLSRLAADATHSNGRCALRGVHDVPSCITEGSLPDTGWEPRIGSLDGANIAIDRTAVDIQRVSLVDSTLTYLNDWHEQPARWSGVLDGGSIQQPIGGIAEWVGSGKPHQCLFEGKYALDRALRGSRMNNLRNLLAERYPDLIWTLGDVWGYCTDTDEPVVVIPTVRQAATKSRTVNTYGGFIIVRGDNGKTTTSLHTSADPGEYPGPVYPMSLVARQRRNSMWAAGRQNMNRNKFGFDPASSSVQAGNVSEYLLKNAKTGRLEWVTPLTLRSSKSEVFVAYAVTPADTANAGRLNPLRVYVLDVNDPRRINIDNLEVDARNYLATNAGQFVPNGGKLVEFSPITGTLWRAFGELNGRVIYRLDISADAEVPTRLVKIDPNGTGADQDVTPSTGPAPTEGPAAAPAAGCGAPPDQIATADLASCIEQFTRALAGRAGGGS